MLGLVQFYMGLQCSHFEGSFFPISNWLLTFWCTLYRLLSRPTNVQHTHIHTHIYKYIYELYFIYRKHCYMFRYICTIFRQSHPSALLKLHKPFSLHSIKSVDQMFTWVIVTVYGTIQCCELWAVTVSCELWAVSTVTITVHGGC